MINPNRAAHCSNIWVEDR